MSKDSPFSDTFRDELKQIVREAIREELTKLKPNSSEEKLLNPKEAAEVLGVSVDYLYHNAKHLPFARWPGKKMLRFSYPAMVRWIESKKFS